MADYLNTIAERQNILYNKDNEQLFCMLLLRWTYNIKEQKQRLVGSNSDNLTRWDDMFTTKDSLWWNNSIQHYAIKFVSNLL
jgi:hypothetical protein